MSEDPLSEEGDKAIDLSDIRPEDGLVLVIFWVLAAVVFLQFFSRYVLNDSIGWTEEIARYLLIGVTFVGAGLAVRKNSHIAVEFFYRYLPGVWGRAFSTFVDLLRVVFFAACTWITAKLALRTNQKMASIELGKDVVYWVVFAAFVAMTLYALRVAWRHWRQGYSALTRPGGRQMID
ncbi:TRAP transporter small permease [Pelagibius sp.]|uniref:TRAP transporter small permease n=1 Tax=Pelagibius sp. TaxID=1931238 RepID=UPI003B50B773